MRFFMRRSLHFAYNPLGVSDTFPSEILHTGIFLNKLKKVSGINFNNHYGVSVTKQARHGQIMRQCAYRLFC